MVVVLIPVVMILFQIMSKGLATMTWGFLTKTMPFSMMKAGGGFLNSLLGTLLMVGVASLISVPVGILAAIYLEEYGKKNVLAQVIRFFSDVMTGVPSVFVGLFVYTAMVIRWGYGALFGGIALAIIMLPIVTRSTEEMLKLVPKELKDGSYALGAAKWQTMVKVVLPTAAPGISTGVMLAIARAAGETAPLILTALGSFNMVWTLTGQPVSALPLAILNGARSPFDAAQSRAWAGALELLLLVVILTLAARILSSRSRMQR